MVKPKRNSNTQRRRKSNRGTRRRRRQLTSKPSIQDFIHRMLETENTIRVYHWNTCSYSVHKTTDKLHSSLSDLVDRYVETFMGKKNIHSTMKYPPIQIPNLHIPSCEQSTTTPAKELEKYIQDCIQFVYDFNTSFNPEEDYDLFAIRDEIVSVLNRSLYLLRFD